MQKQPFFYSTQDDDFLFRAIYTPVPDLTYFHLHTHDCCEIFYLVSGKLTFYIDGNTYNMHPNDMILMNAYELHKSLPDPSLPYERKYLRFKPSFLLGLKVDNYNLFSGLESRKLGHNNLINARDAQKYQLIQAMNEIHDCALSGKPDDQLLIKATLVKMLVNINRLLAAGSESGTSPTMQDDFIKKILEYVNQNLSAKLTLEAVQNEFHISKYHLTRLFKQTTGFSFSEYITYKRIMEAARMIVDSNTLAYEAVAAVGYANYTSFYRAFIRIMGIPPSQIKHKTTP